MTAAFFAFVIGKGLRAQRLPVKAGAETMVGKKVTASTPIDSQGGRVFVEGENWNAFSDTPVEPGEVVEIAEVKGLTLKVKPKKGKAMPLLEGPLKLVPWAEPIFVLAAIVP